MKGYLASWPQISLTEWQPQCTCGWTDPTPRASESAAKRAANRHWQQKHATGNGNR